MPPPPPTTCCNRSLQFSLWGTRARARARDHSAQPFPRQPLWRSMNFVSTQVHLVEAHLTMPDCWLRSAIYIRGRTRSDYARHARGPLVNSLRNESVTTLSRHATLSVVASPSVLDCPCSLHRASLRSLRRSSIFSSRVLSRIYHMNAQ